MIVIIDYNTGNPNSVANMIKRLGYKCIISSDRSVISEAVAVIIPGVGTYDKGIKNLKAQGLGDLLTEIATIKKIPTLGICLGMQLMCMGSDEGKERGLEWFDFPVVRFSADKHPGLRVPQIGWNEVEFNRSIPFTEDIVKPSRFYFANAFYPDCRDDSRTLCKSVYGYPFVSGIVKDNIVGVQFHPEKSHSFGMSFFRSFFQHFLK